MSDFKELTEYAGRAVSRYGDEVSYEDERDTSYDFKGGYYGVNGSYSYRERVKKKVTIRRNGQPIREKRYEE